MIVRFIEPALTELHEAVNYYDYQLPGLGLRIFHEVNVSIKKITDMPEAWTKIGENTRRCLLKGFPYALLYIIDPQVILITAVANLHRDPEHFRNRTF
ncbi:MAG: type II toxin-antitoxin system RelE/ParE family toxin [Proteobacteria bacterium]|nr:type II toxin-antitoxin system RelE/ParE family toxin [Pseudomonadota bacterium]